MTAREVIDQLRYGELRSIAVKDDPIAIFTYINLALIALYGRFRLKFGEQLITLSANIVEYKLTPDNINIIGVYDENGDEFALDDETSLFSINQVAWDTIQVPNPVEGNVISVIYLASPPTLTYVDDPSLDTTVVPIPPQLLEPLLSYVGYRAHGALKGDIKAENNTHLMRYEASCKRIKTEGLVREAIPPAHINQNESIGSPTITYQEVD